MRQPGQVLLEHGMILLAIIIAVVLLYLYIAFVPRFA
jgi:hypothetical protein